MMYWANNDRKTLAKIYKLIKDIRRNGPAVGIGNPERLKYEDAWSRRIDEENRLVYRINEHGYIYIIRCKGHYED